MIMYQYSTMHQCGIYVLILRAGLAHRSEIIIKMSDRNNLLEQYLAALKPKPRIRSFRDFYTRSVKTSLSLPKEQGKYYSTTPNNKDVETTVLDQIGRRKNKSQKVKTEEAANFTKTSKQPAFRVTIATLRKKSLRKMEMQALAQRNVRRKYGEKRQADSLFFKFSEVDWFQKRLDTSGARGRYSQKLHPMCQIYQQCADSVISSTMPTIDPFGGTIRHIDY